jgi:hypothetical protein
MVGKGGMQKEDGLRVAAAGNEVVDGGAGQGQLLVLDGCAHRELYDAVG